jgi:hypothetical protein
VKASEILIGIALLATATACKSKAQKAKEAAAAPATVADFTAKLRTIHRLLPPSETVEEEPCDDAEIVRALGTIKGRSIGPQLVDVKFLEEIEGGPRRAFSSGNTFHEPYDFLVSTRMQLFDNATAPGKVDLVDAADEINGAIKYGGNALIVLQIISNVEPEPIKAVTVLDKWLDKRSYTGGEFDAWAFVFALAGPKLLCQAHVEATNSDKVKFESGKLDQALFDDYVSQIKIAIEASLKRISPRLHTTF